MSESVRLVIEAVVITVVLSAVSAVALYQYAMTRKNAPGMVRRLLQMSDEMSARIEALERKDQQNYQLILDLQRDLAFERDYSRALYAYSQRLSEHSRRLTDMLRQFVQDVPAAPEPPPEPRPAAVVGLPNEQALHARLVELFNMDELDDLAFRIGIDQDKLSGRTLNTRARGLIQYARRRDLLDELVAVAREERPESDL